MIAAHESSLLASARATDQARPYNVSLARHAQYEGAASGTGLATYNCCCTSAAQGACLEYQQRSAGGCKLV